MSQLTSYCPSCMKAIEVPMPVEPLFSFDSVTMLVPVGRPTLERWLTRNRGVLDPPYYTGNIKRRRRMFTASDVRKLRDHFVVRSRGRKKPSAVVTP